MEIKDKDLVSIQEARCCLRKANEAHQKLCRMNQEQIDKIVKAIAEAGENNAEKLGTLAQKETGFGNAKDKFTKNLFASRTLYEAIKDLKTVGILRDDKEKKVLDIGVSVGVIAGLVPSTNPTSTVIFKSLISIKAGNAIVFSPHPNAKNCILETVKCIKEAAEKAGCPEGAISCIETPTLNGTKELMQNNLTALILATGGPEMVKSAYTSGKPAIGVGAGNGPAFIHKSADIKKAIKHIFASKSFDNGTICASEQSIIIEKCCQQEVEKEISAQNGYILNDGEKKVLEKFILSPRGTMNPAIVGKSATEIASLAGLKNVPCNTKVLLARETKVGDAIPFSHEKLCPILAYYAEDNIDMVLEKAIKILQFEGAGHTFCIHANDEEVVKKFALEVPASRILVNTLGSLGGIGSTTNLFPSLTLGCGAVGGSSSSNNIGPIDIINIRRVAYGVREPESVCVNNCCDNGYNESMIQQVVEQIMQKLME